MSNEKLTEIREYIVNNIMRNPDYVFSGEVRGDLYADMNIDLLEVIASLYEVLHREVTGETYNYMFHFTNKVGGWVEDGLFTEEGLDATD